MLNNAGLYEECNKCDDWNGSMNHCCNVCYMPFRALEDYKKLKENIAFMSNKPIEEIYIEAYNKAIDDFVKNLYKIGENRDFDWEDIFKLAEQLKVGK